MAVVLVVRYGTNTGINNGVVYGTAYGKGWKSRVVHWGECDVR